MKKTWVFFKLRWLQLRYDKTALFFSYILPTLMLIGIGMPMSSEDSNALTLVYRDELGTTQSQALVAELEKHSGIKVEATDTLPSDMVEAMTRKGYGFFLHLHQGAGPQYDLYHQVNKDQSPLIAEGFENVLEAALGAVPLSEIHSLPIEIPQESYIKTLMPGLIGMTLLVIGLNGFGLVLVQERDRGVFRKLKTMDASPKAFLGGLLLSRLVVCYGVVLLMYLITYFVFKVHYSVDYLLLLLMVTLGCAAFLLIGLALTVVSKTQSSFNGLTNFIMIPLIVFSGVFFSVDKFPGWLQVISKTLPLTHFNIALQKLFFESASFADFSLILPQVVGLGVWVVLLSAYVKLKFEW